MTKSYWLCCGSTNEYEHEKNCVEREMGNLANLCGVYASHVNRWQPIESAPKDGTKIDLLHNGKRYIDYTYKTGRGWHKNHGYPEVTNRLIGEPTHWMPPPAPPQAKEPK